MYIKGADEEICSRLAADEDPTKVMTHLDNFAAEGLRTLMFGYRDVQVGI